MEQALFIHSPDNLHYFRNDFNRIYFGQEFCERRLPTRDDIARVIDFAVANACSFTFVTPFVTNSGLDRLENLVAFIEKEHETCEVVCNDWGAVHLISTEHSGFTPVLGRLLNKNKRGPRIMNILDKVPAETRRYFCGSNLDVPAAAVFLKKYGIGRVEFDNLLQGVDLSGADQQISASLYIPYAFISTTRFCLTAGCDSDAASFRAGILPCSQECRTYAFTLYNPVMKIPLIRKGNTVFLLNEHIPESLEKGFFNRIVVQPEIPV